MLSEVVVERAETMWCCLGGGGLYLSLSGEVGGLQRGCCGEGQIGVASEKQHHLVHIGPTKYSLIPRLSQLFNVPLIHGQQI